MPLQMCVRQHTLDSNPTDNAYATKSYWKHIVPVRSNHRLSFLPMGTYQPPRHALVPKKQFWKGSWEEKFSLKHKASTCHSLTAC